MRTTFESPAIRRAAMAVSVDQYHRMGEMGILRQDTELLEGVVVTKMVKSPLHSLTVQRLVDWLRAGLGPAFHVRQEQPLTLADSEPEPDIAVVKGSPEDFRETHPATADWIIEVAIASAELDREKARIFAAAGVAEFWLVLPVEQVVEVCLQPKMAGYQRIHRYGPRGRLSPAPFPTLSIDLDALFS